MKKLLCPVFLVLMIAFLCSCELMYKAPEKGKLRVFIYANDYKYGYGIQTLEKTINDGVQTGLCLTELAKASDMDYEVYYFLGKDADGKRNAIPVSERVSISNDVTLDAFLSKVDEVSAEIRSSDMTLFYFGCHGEGIKDKKVAYGTDTSANSKIAFNNSGNSYIEFYSVRDMKSRISSLPGIKVVFSDFCYSGAFVNAGYVSVNYGEYSDMTASGLLGYASDISENPSLFCLSASRYYQQSYEDAPDHGNFTQALLDGLGWDEANGKLGVSPVLERGSIHLLDLAAYIRKNDGDRSGHTQTPMFSGGSSDLVLFSFR